MSDYEALELDNIALQSGMTLRGAWLAYKTYGRLNTEKSNAILMSTLYFLDRALSELLEARV
jgi:homoserine O-acetyltransferase